MSCQVTMTGAVVVGGNCGCSGGLNSGTPNSKTQGLGFACASTIFPAVVSTDCPTTITTTGAVGSQWKELPATDDLSAVYLLVVRGQSPYRLRIGADVSRLAGASGTFPTSFGGGETFAFTVDGVAVSVTFQAGDQTAAQVASRVNQAAIAAGLDFLTMSVATSGQLALAGKATGVQGSLAITTPNATIGFAAASTSVGSGADVDSQGLFVNQFDQSTAPSRVQISGNVQVEVLAAGVAA